MSFSERQGFVHVDNTLQLGRMSDATRNRIWNVLDIGIWKTPDFVEFQSHHENCGINAFSQKLWHVYYGLPIDSRPFWSKDVLAEIRNNFFGGQWYKVYDFIEFVLDIKPYRQLQEPLNRVLEETFAGYRFIDGICVPVTDQEEIAAIQEAIESPFEGVRKHLKTALQHMSDRENPDYRNSIKESISSVESLGKVLTKNNNATLGESLAELERRGVVHRDVKSSMLRLYGYTSNEDGIRHAMVSEPDLGVDEAKFFLVQCSAFINFLTSKSG